MESHDFNIPTHAKLLMKTFVEWAVIKDQQYYVELTENKLATVFANTQNDSDTEYLDKLFLYLKNEKLIVTDGSVVDKTTNKPRDFYHKFYITELGINFTR